MMFIDVPFPNVCLLTVHSAVLKEYQDYKKRQSLLLYSHIVSPVKTTTSSELLEKNIEKHVRMLNR